MPYIGNTVQNQGFAPAIDYFSGNGVTVTFTLSRPVASVAQMIVAIDNVIQNPSSSFTVSGNAITFTSAPLSGTNNIWVEYTSLITTYAAISQDPSVIGDITASGGFLSTGDFGNTYTDGTIVDYVTGRARITTGPIDDMTFYHGGSYGRSEMMDLYYAGGAKIYGTTALTIPIGTTAQRPGTPAAGMTRLNTSLNSFEVYQNGAWTQYVNSYAIEYVIVAGGGAGSGDYPGTTNGGGGAGGYRSSVVGESSGGGASAESALNLVSGTSYTVVVGAGGAGATISGNNAVLGSSGGNSSFSSITSLGGGYAGTTGTGNGTAQNYVAASGGSGGGQANQYFTTYVTTAASGTSGQGYAGGIGAANGASSPGYGSGGGGGAGAAGANGTSSGGGAGGVGVASSITGTSVYRAGGGGGGAYAAGSAGAGGNGGGGAGTNSDSPTTVPGVNGTVNTGGGGGGSHWNNNGTTSSSGGSGIVIIRYLGTQKGTGGTVTSSGGYTIHTFTSSGTYIA